jgi:L-histidine Nalpha-methyltransferase
VRHYSSPINRINLEDRVMPALGYTYDDHLPADFSAQSLRDDVRTGLTALRKWLPPKWFYDKVGSELFEDITALREYYPTRTERAILAESATAIVGAAGADTLIELGSGSSEKTRLLLDAMLAEAAGRAERRGHDGAVADPIASYVASYAASPVASYVALDVSEDALRSACAALVSSYPLLRVGAMRADFTHHLELLPGGAEPARRTVAFLGSTIGNFEPAERGAFLRALRAQLGEHDHFLLGADLVKSADVLVPAYDDAAGVTAAFNLNLLDVLNHSLRADFDRTAFDHVVVWDAENEWIEMRLRATRDMVVHLPDLDLDVCFDRGEDVRTEVSAKFRRETLTAELAAAGFVSRGWWTDQRDWFSLSLWGTA